VLQGSPDGVSVAQNCSVVIAVRDTGHLVVLTHTGQLVKDISLSSGLFSPRHAILLDNDQFLLCHGWGSSAYGICVITADGHIIRSAVLQHILKSINHFVALSLRLNTVRDGLERLLVCGPGFNFHGQAIWVKNAPAYAPRLISRTGKKVRRCPLCDHW